MCDSELTAKLQTALSPLEVDQMSNGESLTPSTCHKSKAVFPLLLSSLLLVFPNGRFRVFSALVPNT